MIKMKVLIFMAILILTLTGCGKAGQERLIIYSFSGENEQLAVSNGIIVLNGTEETFVGGDLKVTGDFFDDITSYSTTFYTMSGSENFELAVKDKNGKESVYQLQMSLTEITQNHSN